MISREFSLAGAAAALTILAGALIVGGCAAPEGGGTRQQSRTEQCRVGEVLICDTRSSGRISDGRYGRHGAGSGRRKNCSCETDNDLDTLNGLDLPSEPR